jgi:hypothetical protein
VGRRGGGTFRRAMDAWMHRRRLRLRERAVRWRGIALGIHTLRTDLPATHFGAKSGHFGAV